GRRRHTRSKRDWSSDVCSSDLEIELLDGASAEFDQEKVDKGELSPVFFGSALTNFGVETFLKHFLKMTSSPLPRMSDEGEIDPKIGRASCRGGAEIGGW